MISRLRVFNPITSAISTHVIEPGGSIVSEDMIDFARPPAALPKHLQCLFGKLAASDTPARLLTFAKEGSAVRRETVSFLAPF